MNIQIFDVEHGNCALITTPNGKHVLVDCGHNETTGFRPSSYLAALGLDGHSRRLTKLIVSNVDQDHISDLTNVYTALRPELLSRNKHIDRSFLNIVKEDITDAMSSYIDMHETYTAPATPDFGGVTFNAFHHHPNQFDNTNDLSMVTFVQYGPLKVVFPGDLSRAAWLEFLKNQSFVEQLNQTNVFIASHHGREDGYCAEVFSHCKPHLILISDENIKYDTQQDVSYSSHAPGRLFGDGVNRKVLTTRNNGMITLSLAPEDPYGYSVTIEKA